MKNILIITCIFCLPAFHILAQDKLKVALKDGAEPDLYIDGIKYNHAIIELLDQSKIESVNVIKDEQAIKEYNAPNGVVIIKTKMAAKGVDSVDEKGKTIGNSDKEPLVIINGKVSDKEAASKLSPEDIESINVIKGEQAIKEYNAPYGVVIVKTKN